jgi:hypothetical protein
VGRPVLPDAYVDIRDGGLGLTAGRLEGVHVKVGVASTGEENRLIFVASQREAIQKFGSGPLVDALVDSFSSGATIVYAMRAKASIAGCIGGGIGLWVECTAPGERGEAKIRYSLDGGISWGPGITVPTDGEIQIPARGIILNVGGEPMSGGDIWKFDVDTGQGTVTPGMHEVMGNGSISVHAERSALISSKTGGGSLAVGGSPLIEADVLVQIVDPGELNGATYRCSLDGGDNWSGKYTVPLEGETEIPGTGIDLTFAGDPKSNTEYSFAAGDTWQFHTDAPKMSNGDLIEALEILNESSVEYEFIHIVGESARPVWAACGAMADMMFAKHRYIFFLCEARGRDPKETVDEWTTSLIEDAAKFAHWRVSVVAGRLELVDMNSGLQVDRNGAGVVAGFISKNPVQRSIGFVMYNPVTLGLELNPYPQIGEAHIQALDAARYVTFRRYVGLRGIYVTNGRMMAEDISDFRYIELARVINRACRLVRAALLSYTQGEADESGLKYLLAKAQQPLKQMVQDREIVDFRVNIPREQDIISTSEVEVEVAIVPVPIMRWIKIGIGLENPAIRALLANSR